MKKLLINAFTLLAMLTFVLVEIKASDDEYEQWLEYATKKYGKNLSESLKNQMRKFYDARKSQKLYPSVYKKETNIKNEKEHNNKKISKRTMTETDKIFHQLTPELKGRKLSIGKKDEKYRKLWMDIYHGKVVGKKQEEF